MMAGLITNGFYLRPDRIKRLNRAGARVPADQHRQRQARRDLAEEPEDARQEAAAPGRARASSRSTSTRCVGAGMPNPEDARTITQRAAELGFSTSVGILHDETGQLKPLSARARCAIYDEVVAMGQGLYTRINDFQRNLSTGSPTIGTAAPARATCTSAKTGWCTTARSSAAIRASRSPTTRARTSSASTTPTRRARRSAPSAACTVPRAATTCNKLVPASMLPRRMPSVHAS